MAREYDYKPFQAKSSEIKHDDDLHVESDIFAKQDDSLLAEAQIVPRNTSSIMSYVCFPSFPDSLFRVKTTNISKGKFEIWIESKENKKQWKNILKEGDDLGTLGIPFEIMTTFLTVSIFIM